MKPPTVSRRFNPVVDRFVTTDLPLQEIIASTAPSPLPPILTAMVMLCDCLDGRRLARDAIGAAESVPIKGQDPELTILLLARWAELACRISRPSEAEALLHHARSLFTENTHPEVIATAHFATSVLHEVRGNQQEREKLLRQTNAGLPEHSPRRKFYLWELGLLLARQGRGIEFKDEMKLLTWQTGERFPLEQLDHLHFIDAVETGRTRVAAERMSALAAASPNTRRLFREYQQLLMLMHQYGRGLPRPGLPRPGLPGKTADYRLQTTDQNANGERPTSNAQHPTGLPVPPTGLAPMEANVEVGASPPAQLSSPPAQGRWDRDRAEPGDYTPVWIQTLNHLLEDDAPGALRLARLEAKRLLVSIFGTGFGALNLIRAELASGNAEAASRLIDMRAARGNAHYLDPLFAARCALLTDRRKDAAELFREAQAAAERYDAAGRLDFELSLALEMHTGEALVRSSFSEGGCLAPADLAKAFFVADTQPRTAAPVPIPPPRAPAATAPKRLVPRLKARTANTPAASPIDPRLPPIIGRSPAILKLRETILQMASQEVPVLITGETGTGKELVAVALHTAGNRADKPFIPVNCSAISETLLESELFGHERGSFTGADRATGGLFEDAGDGTLLLDEIGDVSPRLQAVLLRVLETGEIRAIGSSHSRRIHCRILAATNADLETRVAQGSFRQDLLYRLQRLTIHVPPLRERREDIMPLVRHFLDEGRPVGTHASVSATFVETARQYDWPGNVRELRNVIERMRLTHSDKLTYTEADLDIRRVGARPMSSGALAKENASPQPASPPERISRPAGAGEARLAPLRAPTPPPPGTGEACLAPAHRTQDDPTAAAPAETADITHFLQHGNSVLRRLERLRSLFEIHRRLTRGEIVHVLAVSPNTATKYLKTLCDEGFIRRVEPSASARSHYFERL